METEYIAMISYGKDSLKMLEVIHSRGLPLDRITTTDVWATDTISANLPPLDAFKERMDQRIWDLYRIEVEHLCARNKDGSKKTYEQMFYHVPVRRERERETGSGPARSLDSPTSGTRGVKLDSNGMQGYQTQESIKGFPVLGRPWCQGGSNPEFRHRGFPAQISPWCRKLKIDKVRTPFPKSPP